MPDGVVSDGGARTVAGGAAETAVGVGVGVGVAARRRWWRAGPGVRRPAVGDGRTLRATGRGRDGAAVRAAGGVAAGRGRGRGVRA